MACTAGRTFSAKGSEALLGLGPGHPPVEHVRDQHFEADGPLHGVNFVDNLLGRPDGLGGTARGEARIGHANIGGLAFQVLLIAGDTRKAGVIPFEVVMLGRGELVVEVFPALFGFRRGLGTVHPEQGGGLVRWQAEVGADFVEPPDLRRHRVEVVTGDEHLPQAVLGRQLG